MTDKIVITATLISTEDTYLSGGHKVNNFTNIVDVTMTSSLS